MPSGELIDEATDKLVDAASDKRTINNTMRHQYKVLTDAEKFQMTTIKDHGALLLGFIEGLGSKREYSIAKTKVEEAVMWAVKGLTS